MRFIEDIHGILAITSLSNCPTTVETIWILEVLRHVRASSLREWAASAAMIVATSEWMIVYSIVSDYVAPLCYYSLFTILRTKFFTFLISVFLITRFIFDKNVAI